MPAPTVTGISPREGLPGTKVTIRGENLGTSQADVLGVAICNKNCSMTVEWASSSKIICRTSVGVGRGDIVVITKSGGTGTSTVKFTGIKVSQVGPLEASAVWIDETEYVDKRLDRTQKAASLSLRTDPLGLNSEEMGNKSQTHKQLAELFVRGSPDPTDLNFEPSWFLVERHSQTSFSKLKEGHSYMKKRANRNTNNAPLNHVKDSLPLFFEVHETLSGIHHKMVKDEFGRSDGNITDQLEDTINEASQKANHLFESVLSCKDRADSIRNTLNVLQRFKFLFNLPLSIERNIQKGDYGVVINDYEKAKSLFANTDVGVFKRVYAEVESRIEDFRSQLRREIGEFPSPVTQQKKLIRHLIGLGESSDPAWDCLVHQHGWVQHEMIRSKDQHLEQASNCGSDSEKKVKVFIEYLKELTHIAVSQIPEHWQLWKQYSSGVILSETGEKTADVIKLKEKAAKHAKQMKGLLRDTVILFVNLLRAAFLPNTLHIEDDDDLKERQSYGTWPVDVALPATLLSECVRTVRESLGDLSSLDLPHGTLQSLKDVIHDLRVLSLSSFLQEAAEDVKNLSLKENWEVNNVGLTSLPTQMNAVILELLAVVRDVLDSLPGEEAVFARVAVQTRVTQLMTVLFTSFASSIEQASFLGDIESETSKTPQAPPLEKRLVIGMSNLSHISDNLLLDLLQKFGELHFPNMDQTHQSCEAAFRELDDKLFEAYTEHRIEPIMGKLEPGMYRGGFDWSECLKPTEVRPYIKLALMGIIAIHAEVFAICPKLVPRVMREVVKAIAEELLRLIHCIVGIGVNGGLQAMLDLKALQQATIVFETGQSRKSFEEALETLPALPNNLERKNLDEKITLFKSSMFFQLRCFE